MFTDMRRGAGAEISGINQLTLSVSAGESGNYYGISVVLMKMCL